MHKLNPKPPLFVDLDGTLIKTDLLLESVLLLLKQNLLALFLLPVWLLKGRAHLKYQLSQRVQIPVEQLPLNPELHAYLEAEADSGRDIILISASNQQPVQKLSTHLGLFIDAIGSDEHDNLKSDSKLIRIQQLYPRTPFAYAGNSSADLAVWDKADEVLMVNCRTSLAARVRNESAEVRHFDVPASQALQFWQAIRPHQWLKNGLVFLPLILSHQLAQLDLLLMACIGFLSFSLCASSVYLLNDMLDLSSDRQHKSKYSRPFAAGTLSLFYGFVGAPLLLIASFSLAFMLNESFALILLTYWLITCLYSFYLKRLFIVDVIVLALLYTIRIVAGSAAISVVTTNWLLAFSLFLFLGLAIVKRFMEFSNLLSDGKTQIEGRAYNTGNLKALSTVGIASSVMAVVVFMFYINAPDITRLYTSPSLLWLICPLLLGILGRIWLFAYRGKLAEDPVLFAIEDRLSQGLMLLCGILVWLAT